MAVLQYLRSIDASDPSSLFFNATRAYERRYSSVRITEADEYIARTPENATSWHASATPTFCIGIVTVQRNGADYFKTLVGSLLEGLSYHERSDLMLTPLIAHNDPYVHQAFNESWLQNLADRIITYEALPQRDKARLRYLETPEGHREKALYDYSYMLETCLNLSTPYMLLLEDDVLAADGWYQRLNAAVKDWQNQVEYDRSIYLRLFYNTRLQGWNSERWPLYLFWSVVVEVILLGTVFVLRRESTVASRILTRRTTIAFMVACVPACIALFFAAGPLTVLPFPQGIHQMNNYGCCSQAFVFPREQVPPLLEYLRGKRVGFRDSLIEEYADSHGLARWALTPSIFQHIGTRSSKWKGLDSESVDSNGRLSTERIWNYRFESWNAKVLRSQHEFKENDDSENNARV